MPTQLRTSDDRSAELAAIFRNRLQKKISETYTEEIGEALERDPVGPHDDAAARVSRYMRSLPVAGKDVIFSSGADGPWQLGVITIGHAGNLVIEDHQYADLGEAMRAVVRRRCMQLAEH